ncbi:hypothetical protein BRD17_03465 [Halobacteriales archaeon SW_7_68_16]|nr:MAG: hypothetical protein BRD17_03465 [Halobacteriales archaeon SW_7_68_16]
MTDDPDSDRDEGAATEASGDTPSPATGSGGTDLRRSLLWGAIGGLCFLVLHGAYLLAGGRFLGIVPVGGVAIVVTLAGTGGAHLLAARLGRPDANEQS